MRAIMKKKRGFTLVELMIVVAIIGVLAALAIFGVRRYILNSKTAEARNSMGGISRGAQMAYDREGMAGGLLALKDSTGITNRLCGSAAPVPSSIAKVEGKKYQSDPNEWGGGQFDGWRCLKFSMSDPQFYMYNYVAVGTTGAAGDTLSITAQGDLDANKTSSKFEMLGAIEASTNSLVLKISPNIIETLPEE